MLIIGARAAARPYPKQMPKAKDFRELIFRGLSLRFYKGFVLAGTVVTWLGTYIFIRAMGNDSWPDFGISVGAVIAMIPLMFNVVSYGIFSSVVIERTKEAQQ